MKAALLALAFFGISFGSLACQASPADDLASTFALQENSQAFVQNKSLQEQYMHASFNDKLAQLPTWHESYASELSQSAYSLIQAGHLKEAEEQLVQAIYFDPQQIAARCNLGYVLNKTGRARQALPHLIFAYKQAPFEGAVIQCLSAAFQLTGNLKKAAELNRFYLRCYPQAKDRDFIALLSTKLASEEQRRQISKSSSELQEKNPGWTKSKLSVCINDGKGLEGFEPSYKKAVQKSFLAWSAAGIFSFDFVDDEKQADIFCQFVDKTKDLSSPVESGETVLSKQGNSIKHASIKLLTKSNAHGPVSAEQMYSLSLHEVGHALGLVQHSPCAGDVMYFTLASASKPSAADIMHLKQNYKNAI